MVRIELTEGDAERLLELFESQLSDLRMEIAGTDSVDFRDGLKRDAALLRRLIEQLSPVAPSV